MQALTKTLIYAAAHDAAERNRRSRGLAAWDDETADAYQAEFDRLFDLSGGAEAWLELPR